MPTLIVACILAIIAIFAYAVYAHYQISCSKDTGCKPSYKCQSGKCVPPGTTVTPPGTVPPENYIVCNSDNCPLPNTCQNNQCVSACSPTNCLSPKICDENNQCVTQCSSANCPSPKICQNNQCITPICTPGQLAKLFPYGDTCDGLKIAGPCTSTDEKYLSFANTGFSWIAATDPNGYNEVISTSSEDECKNKCDSDPNCTIWNYGHPSFTIPRNRCQIVRQPITPLMEALEANKAENGCIGFNYSPYPDLATDKYAPPTYVKIAALA